MTHTKINQLEKQLNTCRDLVLANLILLGQIPAETNKEKERLEAVLKRFRQIDNVNSYCDGNINAVGEIVGTQSTKRVVLSANLDTRFNHLIDHHIQLDNNHIQGPGIANNSLGLAVLISLPEILKICQIELKLDLVLVATSAALGRGEFKGIRHFFKYFDRPTDFCLNLVATNIGRIDHYSYSSVRGDIICELESVDDLNTNFTNNSILILNELINSLLDIPIANRHKTTMNIGQIKGGTSYSLPCPKASLGFYVSSQTDEQVSHVMSAIKNCCIDILAKTHSSIHVDFFNHQKAGGLRFTHPFVKTAINNVTDLGYKPIISSRQSQASIPMSLDIPTITLGITSGVDRSLPGGTLDIEPIPKGIYQILSMLQRIDLGECDE